MALQLPGNLPSTQDDTPSPPLADLAGQNGPDLRRDRAEVKDPAWYHPDLIDGRRWDQSYPFQLLVLDRQDDGTYRRRGDWVYTLPIPPEAMSHTPVPAASVTVSQGGIVEELAGMPLRHIELTGTVGVLPVRPTAGQAPRSPFLSSVFAGTVAGLGRVAASAGAVLDDLEGRSTTSLNLIPDELFDDQGGATTLLRNTGYYQARTMLRFLKGYLDLRRTERGRKAVLALAHWKHEAVYLVTPARPPTLRQAADSPLEYRYNLPLTAWGQVPLDGPGSTRASALADATSPGAPARILNALIDARVVLGEARATVSAVVADADRVIFEPIREIILSTKDAMGVGLALIDMPASIVRAAADTVVAAVAAGQDVLAFPTTAHAEARATDASIAADLKRIRSVAAEARDRTSAGTGTAASTTRALDILEAPPKPGPDTFDRASGYSPGLLAAIPVGSLPLPPTVRIAIRAEVERVRALTREDIRSRRVGLDDAAAAFEDLSGAGSVSAASSLGRGAPAPARPLTSTGFRVAAALSSASIALAQAAARGPTTADAGALGALAARAGRAAASGIDFKIPRSKFSVPLPYGTTIEQLAQRYLGSPDRAAEIIALNDLRAPYVDEVGRSLVLLAPGAGRTVVVADDPALFVGQPVWLESRARPRTRRRIAGVRREAGRATLTMDGADDLDRYTLVESASLHIFAPGTINSQGLVWIPSDAEPDGGFRVSGATQIPEVRDADPAFAAAGVDLMLTPANDLVVTPDGDGRWVAGLAALTQLFRILATLRRGTLLEHPDRGLPLRPGESLADVTAQVAARAMRDTLAAEPAFGAVKAVRVDISAPAARLDVAIEAGAAVGTVALSVEVTR